MRGRKPGTHQIEYDRFGRMRYHPEFHPNNGKPWTTTEQKYLLDYYYVIGAEQISFDLGRTIQTIYEYASRMRHDGLLGKPLKKKCFKRIQPCKSKENHD